MTKTYGGQRGGGQFPLPQFFACLTIGLRKSVSRRMRNSSRRAAGTAPRCQIPPSDWLMERRKSSRTAPPPSETGAHRHPPRQCPSGGSRHESAPPAPGFRKSNRSTPDQAFEILSALCQCGQLLGFELPLLAPPLSACRGASAEKAHASADQRSQERRQGAEHRHCRHAHPTSPLGRCQTVDRRSSRLVKLRGGPPRSESPWPSKHARTREERVVAASGRAPG